MQVTVPVAVAVTVKSSDSVKGDVTVTETVQVKVQGVGGVEVKGSGSVSVQVDVTVTQPVQDTVLAAVFVTVPVAVAVTVKSSDSVKGDVTVTETVQVTVQGDVVAADNYLEGLKSYSADLGSDLPKVFASWRSVSNSLVPTGTSSKLVSSSITEKVPVDHTPSIRLRNLENPLMFTETLPSDETDMYADDVIKNHKKSGNKIKTKINLLCQMRLKMNEKKISLFVITKT